MGSLEFAATPALSGVGRVHFIGVGGAGMSAIARILLARGLTVSGSDTQDSPGLRRLEQLGARIYIGHLPAQVEAVDSVVVSTAIRADNPELSAAQDAGLRIIHRSQALAAAMDGKRVVAVAGTHGKTTTTAMATVLLHAAGRDPSFAVGGDVAALGVNAAFGTGDLFVAEADESDGSFLNYSPAIAVVTNVEPDHLDHYGSAEAVYAAFDDFTERLGPGGMLIVCADDPGAMALANRYRQRHSSGGQRAVLSYGYAAGADIRIKAESADGHTSGSVLSFAGAGAEQRQRLDLQVPGRHNVLNAAAAFAVGLQVGVDPSAAAAGLSSFTGAARRFELKGEAGGVRVFDDYAHHPTEVLAALHAARTVAGAHRVHVLFQPHLFSRTRQFAAEFAHALELADTVKVLDIYPAREDPIAGVSSELITSRLECAGGYLPDPRQAVEAVLAAAEPGDIVLTVGAGDVTRYGPQLVAALEHRTAGER